MSEQLDRIEQSISDQSAELAKITTVLGGSGMGDKGLIEQMQELKVSHYETKADVSRLKWIASGIATVIGGAWAAIATWWNS